MLCAALGGICLLHLYWAAGGTFWRDRINPIVDGKPLLKINAVSCLAVAWILFLMASVPVVRMNPALRKWLLVGMTLLFAVRAVGDFKYVGFFKSVKGSVFAYWDSRLYSPMNLALSALAGLCLL